MKKKYININEIAEEKIMTSYEMKNIVGGTIKCLAKCSWGDHWGYCSGPTIEACEKYAPQYDCEMDHCEYE